MRTCYCGEVTAQRVGEVVELEGWVHRRRDHGGVIFLDVRDRAGIVQVVYDPGHPGEFRPSPTASATNMCCACAAVCDAGRRAPLTRR